MSEYWKSTPKYWCKYCLLYVKDTKFEKQQHEATGRHQGNIQRSLKGLHREQANQERQQQRAKDEVARLNGLVPSASSSAAPVAGVAPTFTKTEERKATLQDRKKQWEQLKAMGIAVGEEPRAEADNGSEWKVVREEVIGEVSEDGTFKKVANKGVHKRKVDEDEEERIAAEETITKRRGWGRTAKGFPGRGAADDEDLDALFAKVKKPDVKKEDSAEIKIEDNAEVKKEEGVGVKAEEGVKGEETPSSLNDIPTAEEAAAAKPSSSTSVNTSIKKEDDAPAPAVVFKKRKKAAK